MVFCIKSIFPFKHTILKLCWANSHKVMSMILTSRYSPLASFSTNLEMKRQESTSVHIIAFITFCINEMFNPFTPISDQGRISHYNINRISSRLMTRIKELQSTRRRQLTDANSPTYKIEQKRQRVGPQSNTTYQKLNIQKSKRYLLSSIFCYHLVQYCNFKETFSIYSYRTCAVLLINLFKTRILFS